MSHIHGVFWRTLSIVLAILIFLILSINAFMPKPEAITISTAKVLPLTDLNTIVAITTPNQESPSVIFDVGISYTIRNYMKLRGWIFLENRQTKGQEVYIEIEDPDGNVVHYSTTPMERPDIGDRFKNSLYNSSGFSALFQLKDGIDIDACTIRFVIRNRQGTFRSSIWKEGIRFSHRAFITVPETESQSLKFAIDESGNRGKDISAYYCVSGWLYLENQQTKGQKVYLQLEEPDSSFVNYSTISLERPDVGDYFKNPLYNSSGFKALIPSKDGIDIEASNIRLVVKNSKGIYKSPVWKTGNNTGIISRITNQLPIYEYGKDIRFSDSESVGFFVSGWSGPEGESRWSDGKESHIKIPVKNFSGLMRMTMTVNPLIYGNLTKQRVKCIVNKTYTRDLLIDKPGDYSINLDYITISNNLLDIVMQYADATSPAKLGLNADTRVLAIAFSKIRIDLPPLYAYGQDIRFTDPGTESYLVSGWSGPEDTLRWSEGKESHIRIPVKNISGRMKITMTANPLIYGNLTKQRVQCIVNKSYIRDLIIDKPGDYSINLENITIRNNMLDVVMRYADAASPAQLGINADKRVLAVAFSKMRFDLPPLYRYGQDIRFTDPESESYFVSGWSVPEDTLRWSEGVESHIRIPLENVSGRMRITLTVNPMIYGNLTKQRVHCTVNKTYIQDLVVDKAGDYSIDLKNITISNNLLDIVMRYADAATPASLGFSNDQRLLAVQFSRMKIEIERQ